VEEERGGRQAQGRRPEVHERSHDLDLRHPCADGHIHGPVHPGQPGGVPDFGMQARTGGRF
jgi:hypothetical protein